MPPPLVGPVRVAFVVAAFDAEATLAATVRSALGQSERGVQVVVVDDGSRDDTAGVAERLAAEDPRVSVVRQANAGPGAARNAGVAASRAPYLVFLDADDLVPPGKVAAQAALLDADADLAVAYSGAVLVRDGASTELPVVADGARLVESLLDGADTAFPCHAALVRRSAFDAVGGFREVRPLVEDLDLWVRMALAGARFRHAREPVVSYHERPGSRSTRTLEVLEGRLPVLETLATALPRRPAERFRRVRERTRYRTLAVARLLAAAGRRGDARRLLLRSLRWGRRPGQVLEVLRMLVAPAGGADGG